MSRSLAWFAVIAWPAVATAQEPRDTVRLTPIVVTATRTPVPASALASAVTVIDGDALRRAGVTTVLEALRGVPSLALAQAGSYGAQTSLFLRGGESDYVRVLVDGVPLNQAGGAINLAGMSTADIERIEVLRGPASVLYGSDAMTGVVQIVTRGGSGPLVLDAQVNGGSYGTSRIGAGIAGGGARVRLSAAVQHDATSGTYPFNNRDAAAGAGARLSWTPDARSDLAVTARYRLETFHYPTDGSGAAVDSNQFQRSGQAVLAVDAGRRLSPRVELRVLLGVVAGRDSTDDRPDNAADTSGLYAYESRTSTGRSSADVRANVRLAEPLLLTMGVAADQERERSHNSYQSSFGPGAGTTDVRRSSRALYIQMIGERGRLAVQAGARLDDNQRFGRIGTWRLGGSYRVAPATRLRVNAGTAFKEPTFGESYSTGFSVGNPDLRPERSASVEAGVEQALAGGRALVALTAFTQRFRSLIQYTFMTAGPTAPNYFNVASAASSGIEIEARAAPLRSLSVSAGWTWLRTVAQDSGFDGSTFAEGKPLLRRPPHSGSIAAEWWPASGRSAGARLLYVGRRDDLDFSSYPAARVTLPAYGRLDVWGRYALAAGSRVALTGRVDNLTGTRYQDVFGFPAPGRRILLGVSVEPGR